MDFKTFVTERLAALTAGYNAIGTNAKKIDELPVQSILDPTSKMHVSRDGISESLQVQNIIDVISNKAYDRLISIGEISLVGNVITIPSNARAQINQIYYNTISDTIITVPYAATGLTRTDILVFNTSSLIVRVPGPETAGIAIRPNIPVNTVLVTEINVTDVAIGEPTVPVTVEDLMLKLDKGGYIGTAQDLDNDKLDKGDYTGDAGILDDRITTLEGAQGKENRFTGKSYALWSGTGLVYDVVYTSYYISDVLYPGGTVQRTLAASDPTNPRFDLIKVDATGVVVATGSPSASPEVPTADPNTELAISPVLVEAGATTPSGVSNEDVYKENAEWTAVSNNGTVNFNATANPFQGTKHIDCGAFTNGQYLKFTDNVLDQIADFDEIGILLNLKSTFSNSAKFSVRFYNGTTAISSIITIGSGSYNFDRTIINVYQVVIVPLSAFTFTSSSFDRIDIVMVGANSLGFRMDNIILYKGSGSSSPEQKAITSIITDSGIANATTKDDTFQFKGANGLLVSAIGKILTFTQSIQSDNNLTNALKSAYDNAVTNATNAANWISTNGANLLNHLSRTDNPHNVTSAQVGAPTGSGTSTGTNTGDETATSIITKIGDGTKINQSYLPSYVDDVLEYANLASFPATGEIGKIYVAIDSSKQYRWTGSAYLQITNGLIATTNDVPEGSSLYFTTARVLATVLTGISFSTGGAIVSTDSVLIAFGKIQKQINDLSTVYQVILTDVNFGSFVNGLTGKTTPIDADSISIVDSADSNKQKKVSLTNFKAYLKTYFDTLYSAGGSEPAQITITTTVSITTATLDSNSKGQSGKNVVIDNSTNAINITVNGGTAFVASYLKHGTGAITFVQGSGRTLVQVDGTAVLNGAVGSTATISSIGTKDYLRISNT